MDRFRRVLIEPWGLGDAVIAASVLRVLPPDTALACASRWHPILHGMNDRLLPLDLPYTTRDKKNAFDFGHLRDLQWPKDAMRFEENVSLFSIRGDFRDYWVAQQLFSTKDRPHGHVIMSGWYEFLARRSQLLNLPFALGKAKVRNRYQAWAQLLGVNPRQLDASYKEAHDLKDNTGPLIIHLGAQWRSRQYPHIAELTKVFKSRGHVFRIVASSQDHLPPGVGEGEVERLDGISLVSAYRQSRGVIANDSGPMHLAAFIGCRTWVLSRVSNIQEWLPPGVTSLSSVVEPIGYRPDPLYATDQMLNQWVSPVEVAEKVLSSSDQVIFS